jgi:hypothetical protein
MLWWPIGILRGRESHIFLTIGCQMAVRLSPYAPTALYRQKDTLVPIFARDYVSPKAMLRLE